MIILDPANYSSNGVREETAELASFALSLNGTQSHSLPSDRNRFPQNLDIFRRSEGQSEDAISSGSLRDLAIPEVGGHEPVGVPATGSSALTQLIRSPSSSLEERISTGSNGNGGEEEEQYNDGEEDSQQEGESTTADEGENPTTERTSLLSKSYRGYGIAEDVESQGVPNKCPRNTFSQFASKVTRCLQILSNPMSWNRRAVWHNGVVYPLSLLPSVFLGLLLNILDALSYGMILFPLGEAVFADLGSDGISMFYVSTIIAQVVFSSGGSIFTGGIGSEMIEVVPFFHQMALTILQRVGEDNPKSVIATTILAFSVSSVLTGLVFFLMGTCRLGSLIGFFPRHILIGCIGGVGFFLLQTGVEVSARLSGSLEYNLSTLQKLSQLDTLPLWMIPLFLAIGLLILQRFVRSNFLVGGYFIFVGVIFYIVKFSAQVPMDVLRNRGWVFDAPSSSNPWYHFYTLYGEFPFPVSRQCISLSVRQISLL